MASRRHIYTLQLTRLCYWVKWKQYICCFMRATHVIYNIYKLIIFLWINTIQAGGRQQKMYLRWVCLQFGLYTSGHTMRALHLRRGRILQGANRPWGESSMGRIDYGGESTVHGANHLWGESFSVWAKQAGGRQQKMYLLWACRKFGVYFWSHNAC